MLSIGFRQEVLGETSERMLHWAKQPLREKSNFFLNFIFRGFFQTKIELKNCTGEIFNTGEGESIDSGRFCNEMTEI
jgi:hypothetical protein